MFTYTVQDLKVFCQPPAHDSIITLPKSFLQAGFLERA